MWEKLTVDVIVDEVDLRLLDGDRKSKLSYRFFRKGRRDGKRDIDPSSVGELVRKAVSLGGSTLTEAFLCEHRGITGKIAERRVLTRSPLVRASAGAVAAIEEGAQGPGNPGVRGRPQPTPAHDLQFALAQRRCAREAHDRQDHERAILEAHSSAHQASADIAQLQTHLQVLDAEYLQRFYSVAHTGQILWYRYVNGYAQGHTHRRGRFQPPSEGLLFDEPPLLQELKRAAPWPVDGAITVEGDGP